MFGLIIKTKSQKFKEERELEKQFQGILQTELDKHTIRVDEALASVVKTDVEPRTGPEVVLRVHLPKAFLDRILMEGETGDFLMYRINESFKATLREYVQKGSPLTPIPLEVPGGSYL